MRLGILVHEKNKTMAARFKTFGCLSAIASSSVGSKWLRAKTVEEDLITKNTDAAQELCLPWTKPHSSVPADTIKASLADYTLKQGSKKEQQRSNDSSVQLQLVTVTHVHLNVQLPSHHIRELQEMPNSHHSHYCSIAGRIHMQPLGIFPVTVTRHLDAFSALN
ncbi:Iron-sulfur cluster assembly enzyme ISCU, mitochondrial [Lemmus lemmus]